MLWHPLQFVLWTTVSSLAACDHSVSADPKGTGAGMGANKIVIEEASCGPELMVLGIGQDAGAPQIGNAHDPAWRRPDLAMLATSLGLVDRESGARYLFEASPNITEQLMALDGFAPSTAEGIGIDGIFLTHAHVGHYAGLIYLGREAAGARGVKVYAMPRLAEYLATNGPWEQLLTLENINIIPLADQVPSKLGPSLAVTPLRVPHRDEYSETVAFIIEGPSKRVLFAPDIDGWQNWEEEYATRIEDIIASVDAAYIDATFFDDNELPGRDMSLIPHPRLLASMSRFDALPVAERAKVRFIHLNHTNPARDPDSAESRAVRDRGYNIARRGDRMCLSE